VNRLSPAKQAQIAACLVEGNSVRGTGRLVGATLNTVLRNLLWLGDACQKFHHDTVREIRTTRIEADELYSFILAKDKNLPPELQGSRDFGDMYTWVAIDPDTRLIISWHVGKREYGDAQIFAMDLASRIAGRVQITTDQLTHYRSAIFDAFGTDADYATLRKSTGIPTITPDGKIERPENLKVHRRASVFGEPDKELISTSSIESNNLLMRMSSRRYIRFTNGFSRRIRNKRAALALYFVYYNFCRISPPIRVTPAMEAGLSDRIWEIEDIVGLLRN